MVFSRQLGSTVISVLPLQLKLMVPELASQSPCRWLYPVTYGGGLVEGDAIDYTVNVAPRCGVLVTTQSATKVSYSMTPSTCTCSILKILCTLTLSSWH